MLSPTQHCLLRQLAEGKWISGQRLAEKMAVSRTTIWKHIHRLKSQSVLIDAHPKKGYRLCEPLRFLNKTTLLQQLSPTLKAQQPLIALLNTATSTNDACKKTEMDAGLLICCSEEQTAGKGRLGRHWNSPFAENLYCSLRWTFKEDLAKLSGLSIVVSLALLDALTPFIRPKRLQIKWPNDVLFQNQKIAGILTEIISEPHHQTQVIIGFGVNVNTNTERSPLSAQPHSSLRTICQRIFDRNEILSACLNQVHQRIDAFTKKGGSKMLNEWRLHDALFNKPIRISQGQSTITGIARGINPLGQLQLETPSGLQLINSGDASICKNH